MREQARTHARVRHLGCPMGFARLLPASLCVLTLALIGCGASPLSSGSNPINDTRYSGSVHGGQQPVVGATIQLYTVGTTADGSAATPLLTSTVTSDSTGSFTITGLYSCTGATQVYIVATGGNPGLATPNPNIALMAALGPCSSLTSSTFISINELTTAAAISALAPFMTSATAIGSSSSDTTDLANAFTLANQYVNTTTGASPGANVPSGDTVPTTELNTLADIISACINSTGGTAGDGSLCGDLFSLTTVAPNPAPTNTIAAMLVIADNPTLNTSALYALTPPTPPFQPTLTSAPANFVVSLQSPAGQADVSSIDFQDVTVGSASPIQTINLPSYNSSKIVGANPGDFVVGNFSSTYVGSCGYGGVPSNGPCWIQVYAHPFAAGLLTASIEISYDNGNSTLYIPLSVTGIASTPSSALSNSYIDFPPTLTGASATPVPVTVNNPGPGTLTVSGITIAGAVGNNFTESNNCSSVAVNASCTIYVTFAPTSSGSQSATLQVASITSGPNTVALSGIGVSSSDPPSLWPPSLTYTIWGANEDLILTNPGSSAISGSVGAGTTGGLGNEHSYPVVTNGCGSTLASGSSCAFTLGNVPNVPVSTLTSGFSSVVTGQGFVTSGSTTLTSNIATNNVAYLYLGTGGVNGNGIGGTITFPTQQVGISQTSSIQLFNVGSGSPAASLAIGGANPGDFSVSAVQPTVSSTPSSFCPAATTGTSPCTITVTFNPTAPGTRTAKISLDSNGTSTGQYIYVTGSAVGPGPYFTVNSSTVSLASYYPVSANPNSTGSVQLTLTNIGTTTIDLAATFTGANPTDMSANVSNCSAVAPQATCTFTVGFSGPAVGNYSANLVLSDTSSTFSLTIPITAATGYWPPTVSPSVLTFGNQPVGSTSTKQFFRVMDGEVAVNHPISVSLQSNSNFTLPDGSTCPASEDESCSLTVAFAPQTAGSISEYLTITDTTDNLQTSVHLTGTAVSPDYTLSAYSVAFPSENLGTSNPATVTLTNVSNHSINVSGVSVIGAQNGNFTATTGCSTVAVNGTCSINITFAPTAAGMQGATVSISSNASNSIATIPISGIGQ